jgi:para-nitrobenzyl esterase
MRTSIATLAVVTVALGMAVAAELPGKPLADTLYIRTDLGLVHGINAGSVDEFLGLPYASPPTGDLRWKAPISAVPWRGVRDATVQRSACTQVITPGGDISASSEDCLYLNIYRPARSVPGRLHPVVVFIHGGSNKTGSGNEYDPSEMVSGTDIMVVTIDYRLGVFGFLALPSLDAETDDFSSGNYGLMDQQAALRWVGANIREFGGDPSRVTVDGESAGGIDICASLASPTARGLFSKAIMESLYCPTLTHAQADEAGVGLATSIGCADPSTAASCMRSKTASELLQASQSFNASPNIGGRVLPLDPLEAFHAGQWNRSAILLGSNHDEATGGVALALHSAGVPLPLTAPEYVKVVGVAFKSVAPAVLNEYSALDYPSPFYAFAAEETDSQESCRLSQLAHLFSTMTATYQYEFADPSPPIPTGWPVVPPPGFGAYHGSELQYLFRVGSQADAKSPAQRELSLRMMRYWADFARTGNPNGRELTFWPRQDLGANRVLSFKPTGDAVIQEFDANHHCEFWWSVRGYGTADR